MKKIIKKLLPKNAFCYYHKFLALFSAFIFGYPSEKLIVIGVTGTNGKSTTANLIAKVLEVDGAKVGLTSTVNFKVADKEWLNNKKMTMLGRFQLQKLLKQMVEAKCKYAVIEVSSEGIKQFRHLGINFDYAVFTNLTPEHLESHGGFENYKKAKGQLFVHLNNKKRKNIFDKKIEKVCLINIDDDHADYFLNFSADKKVTFALENKNADLTAGDILVSAKGTEFDCRNLKFNLQLIGKFNVYNCLPAIAIGLNEKIELSKIQKALSEVRVVPGRMELIDEGQDFSVIVDYAPEPASMAKLYETVSLFQKNKVIHVLGSCGGGRDKDRRPILGKMAGKNADFVIVTNEDPYDDQPMEIIDQVAQGSLDAGKILNENLFKILDRHEAIAKALSLAKSGDLILITGKGSEQAMAIENGKYLKWDDREVVKNELQKL